MDQIYSVSEITQKIKYILESGIPDFFLEGEISEFRRHGSGHLYFTLKDDGAVIPSVMWRGNAQQLGFTPRQGDRVLCRGALSVYAPQGKYQFVARNMKPAGSGDLFQAFEALKQKLRDEGLFDPAKKRSVPEFPMHVAIITSESGAALQDMLRVFKNSAPHISLTVLPARVQGSGSAGQIMGNLDRAEKLDRLPDAVIIARGGGSLEDLWEFNSEALARRIASFTLPVISGVGHETDFSICDFTADLRASTPTAAAEVCVRNWKEMPDTLNFLEGRTATAAENALENFTRKLDTLMGRHGFRRHSDLMNMRHERLDMLLDRFFRGTQQLIRERSAGLDSIQDKLKILNPASILERGFSINRRGDGSIIRSIRDITVGETFTSQYRDGTIQAQVTGGDHEK